MPSHELEVVKMLKSKVPLCKKTNKKTKKQTNKPKKKAIRKINDFAAPEDGSIYYARKSRPIRCAGWIVKQMHYPTNRPTDRRTQPIKEVLWRT